MALLAIMLRAVLARQLRPLRHRLALVCCSYAHSFSPLVGLSLPILFYFFGSAAIPSHAASQKAHPWLVALFAPLCCDFVCAALAGVFERDSTPRAPCHASTTHLGHVVVVAFCFLLSLSLSL